MQLDLAVDELMGALVEEYRAQNGYVGWGAPDWQRVLGACVEAGREQMKTDGI